MAQIVSAAYYGGSQWTASAPCGLKNTPCKTPWLFLGALAVALMAGKSKKARARRVRTR